MQIIRVDEQGFALSDEDIDKLAGSNLWMEMMKNRVLIQSHGFEQEIMKEIDKAFNESFKKKTHKV